MTTTFTGTITRTELSLSDLAIGGTSPYRVALVDGLDAGTVTRRRVLVTSPYVEDAFETISVRDQAFMTLTCYVTGANVLTTVQSNAAALIAALSQSTYTLTAIVGGATYAWACRAADYSLRFNEIHSIGRQATVVANIPRSPAPVSGPI